jgi:hypothetical protein
MKSRRLFQRILPAIIVFTLLVNALVLFMVKYQSPNAGIPISVNPDKSVNRLIFLRTFYMPFVVYSVALAGCIFSAGAFMRRVCLITGFAAAVLCVYISADLFTINIFIRESNTLLLRAILKLRNFLSPKSNNRAKISLDQTIRMGLY